MGKASESIRLRSLRKSKEKGFKLQKILHPSLLNDLMDLKDNIMNDIIETKDIVQDEALSKKNYKLQKKR